MNLRSVYLGSLVALLGASRPAFANDSTFGGCSGTSTQVTSAAECLPIANPDIALVDEKLSIVATLEGSSVVATYTFENTGPATSVTIGFPVDRPSDPEGPEGTGKAPPALKQYLVTADGKRLKYKVFSPYIHGGDKARTAATAFEYDEVYLVDITFAAGQKRVLEHRYRTSASFFGFAYVPVRYILKTGANWKGGTIGQIEATVRIDAPIGRSCLRAALPGTTFDIATRTFTFKASNWEPSQDLLVTFEPAGAMAQILFGTSEVLPDTSALAKLSPAAAAKALAEVKTDALLEAYTGLLATHSAAPGKASDGSLCYTDLTELPATWNTDPNVTLASFPKWAQVFLRAAHARLTAEKVDHLGLAGL